MIEHPTAQPAALPIAPTMRAAVLLEPGRIAVQEVPTPQPNAGEVLVRLEGCGVCASNLGVWEGAPWFTYPLAAGEPGHEGWGRVAAVGAGVTHVRAGERVAMLSYRAYAEYDTAAADAVVPLPSALDGVPLPGEPLGCAVNIFRRSRIEAGQTVAIVGIGFLGALLVQLCAGAGARVIAVNRRESGLALARQYGAAETILMDDYWRNIEQMKALTDGRGCECVIEATGAQYPLDLATEFTRERGLLVIAGYHQDGMRQVKMQVWNWRGLDVINAHEREQAVYLDGIRRAVDLVAAGRLDASALYTHRFPLEGLADALEITRARPDGFMKALIAL